MLVLKNISRIYKPKKGVPVKALDQVNLEIAKTGMVFILGKSGSGKSTFLNVVGGLDKYDEGELIIKDKSTKKFTQNDFDSYRNTMIGFIFQEYNVLDEFTVAQNIGLALELQGIKATNEKVNEILDLVDLSGYGARKPNELSGGQKQRVAIARALVKNPEIIMADEPTGALDSETGKQILQTLKKLSETRLVIVVSHDREYALNYGDRIIEFMDGKIISDVSKTGGTIQNKNPFKVEDNKLLIKGGYELTANDLKVINDYIKLNKIPVEVMKDSTLESKGTFNPTNTSALALDSSAYIPIKSKLPFKSSLKIGASALKYKKFRLVLSIILAAVSFGLFGISDTLATYKKEQAAFVSIKESGIDYLTTFKTAEIKRDGWIESRNLNMFKEDIDDLNKDNPNANFFGVYELAKEDRVDVYSFIFNRTKTKKESTLYPTGLVGYTEVSTNFINQTGYNLVSGRKPEADNEIVISKYLYGYFTKFSLRTLDGNEKAITKYDDLLDEFIRIGGKTYQIVGIIDTKADLSKYENINFETLTNRELNNLEMEVNYLFQTSFHLVLFTNPGHNERNAVTGLSSRYNIYPYFNIVKNTSNENRGDLYIDRVGEYNDIIDSSSTIFLKNKTKNNLADNDIVISLSSFEQIIYADQNLYNLYKTDQDLINEYLESLPVATLQETLETVAGKTYDPDPEQNNEWLIKQDFIELFYDIYQPSSFPLPSKYKSVTKLKEEYLPTFIGQIDPQKYFYYTDEYDQVTVYEDIFVSGVYIEKENNVSNGYFSDYYINKMGIIKEGSFKMAITTNTNNDELLKMLISDHFSKKEVHLSLVNNVILSLDQINFLIEQLSFAFIFVGLGFAVFASLMLLNFISISVSSKSQEIGILRAIGARGRDVLGIFTKESMIIALINFVLALTLTIFAVIYLNIWVKGALGIPITILSFGIRQIGLMFGVSITVAFISSALPVIKTSRKRPIDAIRNK